MDLIIGIERLLARWPDAHLLLCRADNKAPAQPWLNYYPDANACRAHQESGGLIGLVPAGIGFTVLDVDHGHATALALEYPPAAFTHSRRPGGAHLWYPDNESRGNAKWDMKIGRHDLSGEVRSGNGYVILWPQQAPGIVEMLLSPFSDAVAYQGAASDFREAAPPPPIKRQLSYL